MEAQVLTAGPPGKSGRILKLDFRKPFDDSLSAKTSSKGLTTGEQMALQGFNLRCKSVVFCVFICVLLYTELFYYSLTRKFLWDRTSNSKKKKKEREASVSLVEPGVTGMPPAESWEL